MTDLSLENDILTDSEADGRKTLVFKLAKRKFAIGLHWLVPEDKERLDAEIKRAAGERKANLSAVRHGDTLQFGLGSKADGLHSGAISAAAALSDQLKGTFCGVFAIAKGWWFVSQRDDYISPSGDCFYQSEAAAKARFDIELQKSGWQRIFAPKSWGIDSEEIDPTDYLISAKGPKLKGISPLSGYTIPLIISAAIIAGAVFGVMQFMAYEAAKERAAAAQHKKELADAKRRRDLENAKVLPPWPDKPHPGVIIQACAAGMQMIQPNVPGWTLNAWTCQTDNNVKYTWNWVRLFGPTSWMNDWFSSSVGQSAVDGTSFDDNGDAATTTLSGPRLERRGEEPLSTERKVALDLNSVAITAGWKLKFAAIQHMKPPANVKAEDWKEPSFVKLPFEIKSDLLEGTQTILDGVPGLVITNMKFDPKSSTYVIKGDIYVQN